MSLDGRWPAAAFLLSFLPHTAIATMSLSLYGDLPKPKTAIPEEIKGGDPSKASSLYGDLPKPGGSSPASMSPSAPAAGWSAITQFKPIIRKPVIQAKPKLHKPAISQGPAAGTPATATSSSQPQHQIVYSAPPTSSHHDMVPGVPGSTKAFSSKIVSEDVNGFKAIHQIKEKRKGKGKNRQAQNQPPPQLSMDEDYDPFRPNDYEMYKMTEKRRKEELAAERETQRRRTNRVDSRSRSRSRSVSRSKSRSPTLEVKDESKRLLNQFAPPPSLYEHEPSPPYQEDTFMQPSTPPPLPHYVPFTSPGIPPAPVINLGESADEAWMRRARMSNRPAIPEPERSPEPEKMGLGSSGSGTGQDVARRLMSKYGWQEGQGLGKSEDGIREALQVQQTGRGAGVIVNTSAAAHIVAASPPGRAQLNQNAPTKVILLTNMVGPGEVDDMLQEETADECSKYGKVERCLIFEVPNGKLPDSESVRIFVRFESEMSASHAISDLNGRYFGGRIVHARFFSESRFEKLDLAPSAAEMQVLKGQS